MVLGQVSTIMGEQSFPNAVPMIVNTASVVPSIARARIDDMLTSVTSLQKTFSLRSFGFKFQQIAPFFKLLC